MLARRILYSILSLTCVPLFWVEALDQRQLVSTRELGDAGQHGAMAMLIVDAFRLLVVMLVAAIILSIAVWRRSPGAVRLQIATWFALLAFSVVAAFVTSPATPPSVDDRITAGWFGLAFLGTLIALPAVYFVLSLVPRRSDRGLVGGA